MKSQLNYYLILNVTSQASEAEIKTSFLKLVRRYHPDKNSGNKLAEKKFKQINLAYQVLKDSNKRQKFDKDLNLYEQQLKAQLEQKKQLKAQQEIRKQKLENKAISSDKDFSMASQIQKWFSGKTKEEKAIDVEVSLSITIEDLCKGASKKIDYIRPHNGMRQKSSIEVQIPSGAKQGSCLQFKNKGGANGKKVFGNLFVKIQIQKHPLFEIKKKDVYLNLPVQFTQAFSGAKVLAPSPYGVIEIVLAAQTKSDHIYRFKNLGLPSSSNEKGDMFVKIFIDYPKGHKVKIENEMKTMPKDKQMLYIQQQNFKDEDYEQVFKLNKFLRSHQ